jgi:hypothetical protein
MGHPTGEGITYVQEMIEDKDTPPSIKAKSHYLMAIMELDKSPEKAKVHLEAANGELKKAKAMYVSEAYDEFLRTLEDELEKEETVIRKREAESNASGTD